MSRCDTGYVFKLYLLLYYTIYTYKITYSDKIPGHLHAKTLALSAQED